MIVEQKSVAHRTADRALGQHVTVGQCLEEELMSFETNAVSKLPELTADAEDN
jgi:hypothetical protein